MTSYILRPEAMYNVAQKIGFWHDRALRHREYVPVTDMGGFKHFEERWYNVPRPGRPVESRSLEDVREIIADLEQSTANVVFYSYDLNIRWPTLQVSRAGGQDIQNISLQAIMKQMALTEAAFCHRGSNVPSVNGLFGSAGNESTDSTAWGTAPGASTVVQTMSELLIADGFDPPFDLIMSSELAGDLLNFINAAPVAEIREWDSICRLIGQPKTYWPYIYNHVPAASEDLDRVYPLPAVTGNDGNLLMVKSDPANFELLVEHPLTTFFGNFDVRTRSYPILVFAAYSFRVWEANSICKHTQVDLAA